MTEERGNGEKQGKGTKGSQSSEGALQEKKKPLPKFEMEDEGAWGFHVQTEDEICNLFGCGTQEFAMAMVNQCGLISGVGDSKAEDKNYAIAIVDEIKPRDGIEGMLATQMAAVHLAMMRHSRMLAGADTIQLLDAHEKVFNKLARTFTAQMEALRKHRRGGQQKVIVEHVTVNDGGQAIVGTVTPGGAAK